MQIIHSLRKWLILLLLLLSLTGCNAGKGTAAAPAAIEAYFSALVGKDVNALVNRSCAAWESNARSEFESFSAVTVSLENMACQESENDGQTSLVACTGKIVANYGNEVLEINLADRVYQAVKEQGEWRMCGYK
jgi:hypothetical protein